MHTIPGFKPLFSPLGGLFLLFLTPFLRIRHLRTINFNHFEQKGRPQGAGRAITDINPQLSPTRDYQHLPSTLTPLSSSSSPTLGTGPPVLTIPDNPGITKNNGKLHTFNTFLLVSAQTGPRSRGINAPRYPSINNILRGERDTLCAEASPPPKA